MHTASASFRRFATVLLCACVLCGTGLASSIRSVSATAGSNSCSQAGTTTAGCNVSLSGNPNGPATASGLAIATWDTPGGRLEATSDGFGPSTSATASVSYSNMLIVTGASGSGDLVIQFDGFQNTLSSAPGTASVSPRSVTLGANSTSLTFPLSPGSYSATLPVSFGVFGSLTVSFLRFGERNHVSRRHVRDRECGRGSFSFSTFVVTDANGAPISGASVGFIPEPATFALLLLPFRC